MKNQITPMVIAAVVTAAAQMQSFGQAYTLVDLAPGGNASANGMSSAGVVGYMVPNPPAPTRATLWDGTQQFDLHPSFLDDAATGTTGRSTALGISGSVAVGWGYAAGAANSSIPVAWNLSAGSSSALSIPFASAGGQALATDGSQIVGYANPLLREGTTTGPAHALLWDAASGAATDLGDAGNGAQALGVGGGQQVGYVVKTLPNAAIWRGSSKSLVTINPKDAVISMAYGTDGTRQVGYAGYNIRVRTEAAKGNNDKRFNYTTVWTGTAESAFSIHPYQFMHSQAVAVNGNWIAGYASNDSTATTPTMIHAIVWDANYNPTDLNAFVPAEFSGSQATSVDANGNVAGFLFGPNGTRRAVIWVRNAQ